MDIIGITICVNYADILKHMIHQNSKFLKKWYIVTSPEDKETIHLIKETNNSNIDLLIYDDFYKNAKFNKGGSLRFAQENIIKNHQNCNILILDADIFLPDDFMEKIPKKLMDNILYGTKARLDYWSLDDFINNTNPHNYKFGGEFVGFFQLYKESVRYKYSDSKDCSHCDMLFLKKFSKKIKLDLTVKHLGQEGVNWYGRDYEKHNKM